VLPALIRKFYEAKTTNAPTVTCWGTGAPMREFLYVEDLARACVFLLENYSEEQFINVGSGKEVSVRELTETIQRVVGLGGEIVWDKTKPDGMPRKLMDSSRLLALGWRPQVELAAGIRLAYLDFLKRYGWTRAPGSPRPVRRAPTSHPPASRLRTECLQRSPRRSH
jgi:GDP-L-fucose synthase